MTGKPKYEAYNLYPPDLVAQTWNKVFDFDFPVWDGETKEQIATLILMYYFTREIGSETWPLFKLRLRNKMMGIMPYYVKMATLQLDAGNVFENFSRKRDTDRDRTENRDKDTVANVITDTTAHSNSTSKSKSGSNETSDTDTTQVNNETNLYSDTPQNGLSDVINGKYLTNATADTVNADTSQNVSRETSAEREDEGETTNTGKQTGESSGSESEALVGKEVVVETESGFNGDKAEVLIKSRDAFASIELMIIKECAPLFMGVYG